MNAKEKYISGFLSGFLTTAALHPLEVVRVRLFFKVDNGLTDIDSAKSLYNRLKDNVLKYIRSAKTLYNGFLFNVSTSCVKHMAIYPTQEFIRDYLLSRGNNKFNADLGSSVGSGIALSFCTTPINVIKVPLQSNTDKSRVVVVVKDVYSRHGLRGFARGGISTGCRDVTWNVSYFVLFSYLCENYNLNKILASLIAGYVGITLSYPLDNGRLALQNPKGNYSFWYGFKRSFSLSKTNIGSYLTHFIRVPLANTFSHLTYLSINKLLLDQRRT